MDDILKIYLQSDAKLTVINFISNDLLNFCKKEKKKISRPYIPPKHSDYYTYPLL